MSGLQLLPALIAVGGFALLYHSKYHLAEKRAAGWEKLACDQVEIMEAMRACLQASDEAIQHLMDALDQA